VLSAKAQALSTRDEHLGLRRESEELAHHVRGWQQVFEVIQQQEEALALQMTAKALGHRLARPLLHTEGLRDGRKYEPRIRDWRERNEEDAILEFLHELDGRAKGEARLTHATGSRERDKAHARTAKQLADVAQLSGAADERARLRRQVGVAHAPEGWELWDEIRPEELEEPLGLLQILEAMLAEVAELYVRAKQVSGRL